jgi:septal ring factor EnvC (AmiA/AmiB activator)
MRGKNGRLRLQRIREQVEQQRAKLLAAIDATIAKIGKTRGRPLDKLQEIRREIAAIDAALVLTEEDAEAIARRLRALSRTLATLARQAANGPATRGNGPL